MAFDPKLPHLATPLGAALLTAVLVWFGTGLHPLWPLLWFAPLPVLSYALHAGRWQSALVALLGWGAGNFNLWGYYHAVLHLPSGALAGIFTTEALAFTLALLLFRALARRGAWWSALSALPSLWVCGEYLSNRISPHGTSGSLSYSQLDFLPFLQLASITGPWGMSFVLLLFPAALALCLYLRRRARRQGIAIGVAGVALTGAVLVFGALRLALSAPAATVRVGLAASDTPDRVGVADEHEPTAQLLADYAAVVKRLAAQHAKVIVLPEKLGVVVDPDTWPTDSLFQDLADGLAVQIIVGLIHVTPPLKYNEARIYTPNRPLLTYDKHHLLPPHESKLTPGDQLTILPKIADPWGVAICKDMDFTGLSRSYGRAGVGLMLVPGWDFVVDRWSHGHMAIMRGVESGFAIARSAKAGYLTVSDSRGRVLGEERSSAAPFATLIVDVPTEHVRTLYQRFGDWFVWVAGACLAWALSRRLRL